jgi:hypothetical protein
VPDRLRGRFQLVTNFGTTEHVVNQLNAFKIVHDLTAVGGIMMHELPAQGTLNHGFFAYQPKFFERLARVNGYEVLFLDFRWAPIERGLPLSVQLSISNYVDPKGRPEYGASPAALFAVLRRLAERSFVPPLDATLSEDPSTAAIAQRYAPGSIAFARRAGAARRASQRLVALLRGRLGFN